VLIDAEREPMHGEGVGHERRFQIQVEAAGKVGARVAVDRP
jgi:hypothetical protein